MEKCKHNDCLNCESVDVMKGLCLLDEQFVPFDGDGCPRFVRKPKCKFCRNYEAGEEADMGSVRRLRRSVLISGEMIAKPVKAMWRSEMNDEKGLILIYRVFPSTMAQEAGRPFF